MKPRTLPLDLPIMDLAEEIAHTRALLRAYPFLSAEAAVFDGLFAEWLQLMQTEMALMHEHYQAEAQVIAIDEKFDFLCVAISATLLAESGGDRNSPKYRRYFGNTPPSKLKRPVLGQQLETMRTWAPSLQEPSESAALQGYGAELAAHVTEADAAVTARSDVQRKRADHEISARKAFIDELNSARLALYGQVAALPLKRPELRLDKEFAHQFFIRGKNRRNPSIADVERTILRVREQLDKQEDLLDQMLAAEEEARMQAENAELVAAKAALAEAEQAQAAAAARLEALQARLRED